MPMTVIVGVLAGLASAIIFVSAISGAIFGVVFSLALSPLPIAIAGLGWGWPAAAVAALAGAGAVGAMMPVGVLALHALAAGAPFVFLSYLVLLNRAYAAPDAPGQAVVEWYPTGRVLAGIVACGGALAAIGVASMGGDIPSIAARIRETMDRVLVGEIRMPNGEVRELGEAEREAFALLMAQMMASGLAVMWSLIAVFTLWVAGRVTLASGRLVRPWPDLAATQLPRTMPLVLAGTILVTFLPGTPGLIASGFASALILAYLLIGLAIVHTLTRGLAARPMVLVAVYAALFFLNPLSGLAVAVIGLAEPFSPLRRPPPAPDVS